MSIRYFIHNSIFLTFLFSLLFSTGCATRYGYDYIDNDVILAKPPQYRNLQIQCSLSKNEILLALTRQRIQQDYKYTYRKGLRHYCKDYCGFSEEEKKILLPGLVAFPCITWGTEMLAGVKKKKDQSNLDFLIKNFLDNGSDWGPLVGHYVIFNTILGCGDLVYFVGGLGWSAVAIPIHYVFSRSGASATSYRKNPPAGIYVFMGSPVVNLFFPGYISPDDNHGPLCTKDELYPTPFLLNKVLHKEITKLESQAVQKGTDITLTCRGKIYRTRADSAGKVILPFTIYPLPIRQEKIDVALTAYKTTFAKKPVDLQKVLIFNTEQHLTTAQKSLWNIANNKSLTYIKRFRAMQQLKSLILPEEFQKFQKAPGKYLNN